MRACLSDRALLAVCMNDATPADRAHVELCAACAERYDTLMHDLRAIDAILAAPPPGRAASRPWLRPAVWVRPAAAFGVALAVLVIAAWLGRSVPIEVAARDQNVAGFAADVSTAIFASADPVELSQAGTDAPYLRDALDAGWPCTTNEFFRGECSDQISALFLESERE